MNEENERAMLRLAAAHLRYTAEAEPDRAACYLYAAEKLDPVEPQFTKPKPPSPQRQVGDWVMPPSGQPAQVAGCRLTANGDHYIYRVRDAWLHLNEARPWFKPGTLVMTDGKALGIVDDCGVAAWPTGGPPLIEQKNLREAEQWDVVAWVKGSPNMAAETIARLSRELYGEKEKSDG